MRVPEKAVIIYNTSTVSQFADTADVKSCLIEARDTFCSGKILSALKHSVDWIRRPGLLLCAKVGSVYCYFSSEVGQCCVQIPEKFECAGCIILTAP